MGHYRAIHLHAYFFPFKKWHPINLAHKIVDIIVGSSNAIWMGPCFFTLGPPLVLFLDTGTTLSYSSFLLWFKMWPFPPRTCANVITLHFFWLESGFRKRYSFLFDVELPVEKGVILLLYTCYVIDALSKRSSALF